MAEKQPELTEDKTGVDFVSKIGEQLTEEQKKVLAFFSNSRELRMMAWTKLISITQRNPKTIEESAALFHEIKGIFSLFHL